MSCEAETKNYLLEGHKVYIGGCEEFKYLGENIYNEDKKMILSSGLIKVEQ